MFSIVCYVEHCGNVILPNLFCVKDPLKIFIEAFFLNSGKYNISRAELQFVLLIECCVPLEYLKMETGQWAGLPGLKGERYRTSQNKKVLLGLGVSIVTIMHSNEFRKQHRVFSAFAQIL